MKKLSYLTLLSLFLFNSSCTKDIANTYIEKSKTGTEKQNFISDRFLIKGKVDFSDFGIKNTTGISKGATVSLIYPSNHPDLTLRNTTMCTGLTDQNGNFILQVPTGFSPQINDLYILETSKRTSGAGSANISLRTYLRWNGTKWDSITKNKILISKTTTTLAIISDLNSNILTISDSINRIEYNQDNIPLVTYSSTFTEAIYNRIHNSITNIINLGSDSIELILSISNEGFPFGEIEKTKITTNMSTLRTKLETYAVDWGGIYPNSVEDLKTEAEKKQYWNNFTSNPYALQGTITESIPFIINMSDYQTAKQTLTYKGISLNSISDLKGVIVYEPVSDNNMILKFYIYALDTLGEFLKENGSDYIMTNA